MANALTMAKIKRNLAENCRRLRGKRSLADIAKLVSTSEWTAYPSTIKKIEDMDNNTRLYAVYRLAVAFRTTVDKLISEPKKTDVDEISKNGKFNDQFADL